MKIVTGYRGTAHITAGDTGAFNASVIGAGQYVLENGGQLKATVVSNNQVDIADGDILMNGRHISIDKGMTESLTFENNSASTNRNDLVVCRYQKSPGSGIESAELVVIKGTPTTGTASDPSYNEGDILNGDDLVDMPLYRVQFTGITMGKPVALFTPLYSAVAVKNALSRDIQVSANNTHAYVDRSIASKSDKSHNHDDRYYTETEMNTKLAGKSDTSHNHDSRYYTETEVNNLFGDLLVTKKFSATVSVGDARFDVSLSGYKALGIVGYSSGTSGEYPYYVGMTDATTALLQYPTSASGTKNVTILYAKNIAV